MNHFQQSDKRWWNKPLILWKGRHLPAELVILNTCLGDDNCGAWLNSRSLSSGVVDLIEQEGHFKTLRISLPTFVSDALYMIYGLAEVEKGCPDVVIWKEKTKEIRLLEIKRHKKDRVTPEQTKFMEVAESQMIRCEVVEWDFRPNKQALREF